MVVSHQWTYRFLLHELDLGAVEDALSYCKTLCKQGLAPRTPFWTDTKDIEAIRNRLLSFYVPREPSQVLPRHLCYFQSRFAWPDLDIELNEQDMMALDSMLSCFRAHCREQMTKRIAGRFNRHLAVVDRIRERRAKSITGPFNRHLAVIDRIRQQMWASPPSADE